MFLTLMNVAKQLLNLKVLNCLSSFSFEQDTYLNQFIQKKSFCEYLFEIIHQFVFVYFFDNQLFINKQYWTHI